MNKYKYISHKLAAALIQYFDINGSVFCYHGDDIAHMLKNGYDYNLSFRYMGHNVLMTFNKTKPSEAFLRGYQAAKTKAGIRPDEGRITI